MKKLTALLLLLCLSLNTFAASGSIQELSNAIDDYQYAMTVEWDQKDKAFQDTQMKILSEKVSALVAQGMSEEEILALFEAKMGNKINLSALKLKVSLMPKSMGPKQIMDAVMKNPEDFYSRGASWNGSIFQDETFLILAGVAAVLILSLLLQDEYELGNYECTRYEEVYECTTDVYWYSDTRATETTTCGYKTQCASWREVTE